MCSTALSPIMATAAYADTVPEPLADAASSATLGAMETQCDALAAGYDTGDGDIWSGVVVPGAVTKVSGPTEISGTRDIDESTIAYAGTYVPANTEIRGGPFRIGGSVNMFGDQWSTAGYWTDSTYSFTAEFSSTFSHAFTCEISQEDYNAAYEVYVPAEGAYVVNGDFGDSEAAVRGNCAAFTAQGFPLETRPAWWGVEIYRGGSDARPHCRFEGTQAHYETVPESWDPPIMRYTLAGTPVNQDQTDSLYAFEDHGGPVQVTGEFKIGQVVICISPSTTLKKGVPGAWRPQNGYGGGNMAETLPATAGCNTQWFKVAPWGSGSTTSNGTYISVPNYSF
jgi:hypothetical protein